jgi:hypothetical protein
MAPKASGDPDTSHRQILSTVDAQMAQREEFARKMAAWAFTLEIYRHYKIPDR